ncbi:glycosyltransferase family 4 protein [Pararhizobium antarcticum]|uniref:Glycosyl transferase n=1 Tax=Pararhizobium antarcticum TaxID=1798805 RepID=A0A657LMH4_9HYPH|nr:glycosyltransferase family 4 protein [Pararhizobium antarcticum]OJF92342.1 glycosyl transferase [Pararhizobium antarcticum]OJF94777.1 glycosyl transferase [Rhizobium sp. 58]
MKIAFHSPLKSPHHPVPSGDRLMARLVIAALRQAGHAVEVVTELRTFSKSPSLDSAAAMEKAAEAERARIAQHWLERGKPDVWFCYHPYYKAPDLLGPELARRFGIPYVTAEASHSSRRNTGPWAAAQQIVADAVRQAAVNICFTHRDRVGLLEALPQARTAMLAPFIETSEFRLRTPNPEPGRLVTIAMMRPGDKMDSYRMLAAALYLLPDLDWRLSVIGDGVCRPEIETLFAGMPKDRIEWHGEQATAAVAALLSRAALYVWPGCGEAYGLAYLEAQAAGLPVVAQHIAGVPEVVMHARTGLLTPAGDVGAYAGAIRRLLVDESERQAMAQEARRFVGEERDLATASVQLDRILRHHLETGR